MTAEYLQYQREMCAISPEPRANIGCKEDPAQLGRDFGCANIDVIDWDGQERKSLYDVPNFQVGSIFELPFENDSFGTVVLGDVLEHGDFDLSLKGLKECVRVIRDDGWIIVTVPQDNRPKEMNHAPENLITYPGGFVSWHFYYTDEMIENLIADAGLVRLAQYTRRLRYPYLAWQGNTEPRGWGLVLVKK